MVWATRTVTPLLPAENGFLNGLAFTLWLAPTPARPPKAGVVVVHGADSCKESHHDFARAAVALGLAVVCFDQRGHGESEGRMDARALDDISMFVAHLRGVLADDRAPIALRGSSMVGYLAILAAEPAGAQAVVAICPASAEGLKQGLNAGRFGFAADEDALTAFLDGHDLTEAVRALTRPLLLLHAEGDEQVPIQHSRELAAVMGAPASRLIAVPGGHHRSIQHDQELQAVSLRFIERSLGPGPTPAAS
jgi:alpha-beta hydrolase superfamily lysophospholipase